MANRGEAVQKQIQQDWVNREYIEIITISIKKITDFLNSFDLSCRSKLAGLNEKLTILERKIDYLEACVTKVRKLAPKIVSNQPKETFFYWVNIQFNVVDKERRDRIGPDLSCAEWILRNGGSVKWKKGVITDFNELPQNSKDFRLQEIDASDTNIMLEGFEHFRNCKYIEKLKLHKCYYINDEALKHLDILSESLKHLTISECNNVTDAGIKGLQALHNLRVLILIKLAGVQRMNETAKALQGALTNCKIEF